MPRAYSGDMRQRVIAEVESGASRREAAEEFEVSASTAIIWVKCFRESGRCMPKPRGGSISQPAAAKCACGMLPSPAQSRAANLPPLEKPIDLATEALHDAWPCKPNLK